MLSPLQEITNHDTNGSIKPDNHGKPGNAPTTPDKKSRDNASSTELTTASKEISIRNHSRRRASLPVSSTFCSLQYLSSKVKQTESSSAIRSGLPQPCSTPSTPKISSTGYSPSVDSSFQPSFKEAERMQLTLERIKRLVEGVVEDPETQCNCECFPTMMKIKHLLQVEERDDSYETCTSFQPSVENKESSRQNGETGFSLSLNLAEHSTKDMKVHKKGHKKHEGKSPTSPNSRNYIEKIATVRLSAPSSRIEIEKKQGNSRDHTKTVFGQGLQKLDSCIVAKKAAASPLSPERQTVEQRFSLQTSDTHSSLSSLSCMSFSLQNQEQQHEQQNHETTQACPPMSGQSQQEGKVEDKDEAKHEEKHEDKLGYKHEDQNEEKKEFLNEDDENQTEDQTDDQNEDENEDENEDLGEDQNGGKREDKNEYHHNNDQNENPCEGQHEDQDEGQRQEEHQGQHNQNVDLHEDTRDDTPDNTNDKHNDTHGNAANDDTHDDSHHEKHADQQRDTSDIHKPEGEILEQLMGKQERDVQETKKKIRIDETSNHTLLQENQQKENAEQIIRPHNVLDHWEKQEQREPKSQNHYTAQQKQPLTKKPYQHETNHQEVHHQSKPTEHQVDEKLSSTGLLTPSHHNEVAPKNFSEPTETQSEKNPSASSSNQSRQLRRSKRRRRATVLFQNGTLHSQTREASQNKSENLLDSHDFTDDDASTASEASLSCSSFFSCNSTIDESNVSLCQEDSSSTTGISMDNDCTGNASINGGITEESESFSEGPVLPVVLENATLCCGDKPDRETTKPAPGTNWDESSSIAKPKKKKKKKRKTVPKPDDTTPLRRSRRRKTLNLAEAPKEVASSDSEAAKEGVSKDFCTRPKSEDTVLSAEQTASCTKEEPKLRRSRRRKTLLLGFAKEEATHPPSHGTSNESIPPEENSIASNPDFRQRTVTIGAKSASEGPSREASKPSPMKEGVSKQGILKTVTLPAISSIAPSSKPRLVAKLQGNGKSKLISVNVKIENYLQKRSEQAIASSSVRASRREDTFHCRAEVLSTNLNKLCDDQMPSGNVDFPVSKTNGSVNEMPSESIPLNRDGTNISGGYRALEPVTQEFRASDCSKEFPEKKEPLPVILADSQRVELIAAATGEDFFSDSTVTKTISLLQSTFNSESQAEDPKENALVALSENEDGATCHDDLRKGTPLPKRRSQRRRSLAIHLQTGEKLLTSTEETESAISTRKENCGSCIGKATARPDAVVERGEGVCGLSDSFSRSFGKDAKEDQRTLLSDKHMAITRDAERIQTIVKIPKNLLASPVPSNQDDVVKQSSRSAGRKIKSRRRRSVAIDCCTGSVLLTPAKEKQDSPQREAAAEVSLSQVRPSTHCLQSSTGRPPLNTTKLRQYTPEIISSRQMKDDDEDTATNPTDLLNDNVVSFGSASSRHQQKRRRRRSSTGLCIAGKGVLTGKDMEALLAESETIQKRVKQKHMNGHNAIPERSEIRHQQVQEETSSSKCPTDDGGSKTSNLAEEVRRSDNGGGIEQASNRIEEKIERRHPLHDLMEVETRSLKVKCYTSKDELDCTGEKPNGLDRNETENHDEKEFLSLNHGLQRIPLQECQDKSEKMSLVDPTISEIQKEVVLLFGDSVETSVPSASCTIFAYVCLFATKSLAALSDMHQQLDSSRWKKLLLPIFKALIRIEMTVIDHKNVDFPQAVEVAGTMAPSRERVVSFCSFSTVTRSVDTILGSNDHVQRCIHSLRCAAKEIDDLIRTLPYEQTGSEGKKITEAFVYVLRYIILGLRAMEDPRNEVLREACAKATRTVGRQALVLRRRLVCVSRRLKAEFEGIHDLLNHNAVKSMGEISSPVREQLGELVGAAIRFHLRRLFNPVPPSYTTPSEEHPPPDYSACRSRIHRIVGMTSANGLHNRDSAIADGSISAVLNLALRHLYACFDVEAATFIFDAENLLCACDDSSKGLARDFSESDQTKLIRDIQLAQCNLAASRACIFVNSLLRWPGVYESIQDAGGWTIIQNLAEVLSHHNLQLICPEESHFCLLQDVGKLHAVLIGTEDSARATAARLESCFGSLWKTFKCGTKSRALLKRNPVIKEIREALLDEVVFPDLCVPEDY